MWSRIWENTRIIQIITNIIIMLIPKTAVFFIVRSPNHRIDQMLYPTGILLKEICNRRMNIVKACCYSNAIHGLVFCQIILLFEFISECWQTIRRIKITTNRIRPAHRTRMQRFLVEQIPRVIPHHGVLRHTGKHGKKHRNKKKIIFFHNNTMLFYIKKANYRLLQVEFRKPASNQIFFEGILVD